MPLINSKEWIEKKPPLYWIRVGNINDHKWTTSEREIVAKWIDEHVSGWVYWDGEELYVFEHDGDRIAFKIWATADPFGETHGEII